MLQQAYIPRIMPRIIIIIIKKILSRPLMQEDYYTYCIICRELGYYMLPVYSYLTRQMKSNSLKSGESELSCSKLTLHSFQSEKFMAQI